MIFDLMYCILSCVRRECVKCTLLYCFVLKSGQRMLNPKCWEFQNCLIWILIFSLAVDSTHVPEIVQFLLFWTAPRHSMLVQLSPQGVSCILTTRVCSHEISQLHAADLGSVCSISDSEAWLSQRHLVSFEFLILNSELEDRSFSVSLVLILSSFQY